MRIKEINYNSKYFPFLPNPVKDEMTYRNLISVDFRTDVNLQVAVIKTLSAYGNTDEQIRDSIIKYNKIGWNDPNITLEFVQRRRGNINTHKKPLDIVRSASMVRPIYFKDALHYIDYFCQGYGIRPEIIPSDPREAAFYHISRGRIPLPKSDGGKFVYLSHRPLGKTRLQWKNGGCDYSKMVMRDTDIFSSWDYSNGICLIVPTDWRDDCFLDIDLRSDTHPDGMDYIDESWFHGFHYEKTANGGFHVFGRGFPQKPPNNCGLQLVSTLIVTYPTPGYTINQTKP